MIEFDSILNSSGPRLRWVHLYGLGEKASKQADQPFYDLVGKIRNFKTAKEIAKFKHNFHSEWRGKLLVEVRVIQPSQIGKKASRSLFSLFAKKRKVPHTCDTRYYYIPGANPDPAPNPVPNTNPLPTPPYPQS